MTTPCTWTRTPAWQFVRHYLEMLVAMVVGMVLLGPLEAALLNPLGWAAVRSIPELEALVMASNMSVAMVVWMRHRGHGWAATNEMAAAMYLPFLVLFPPLWLGLITPALMLTDGHLLMLAAMAAAMLLRRAEYAGHHTRTSARRPADDHA